MPRCPDPSRRTAVAAVGAAAFLAVVPRVGAAQAADFPSRPVRIVPFGTAGGPIDTLARVYGERMKTLWGQPVVVDAKPGASGAIAADFVAKAPADGHTLMLTLSLTHINLAITNSKLPYDPVRDFQPLTQIATGGPMLVVPASVPAGNLREFVAWAKQKGRVTYGTWGAGSAAHLFGEQLKKQTGAPLEHVPYKAEAAAHTDMFGGVLDVAWANPGTAKMHVASGRVKVIGITGRKRVGTLPNVATFTEQGLDDFTLDSWLGFYTAAKTPRPVVDKLVAGLREITRDPEVRQRLTDMGFEPLGSTPEEFAASVRAETPRWAELIKAANVTME